MIMQGNICPVSLAKIVIIQDQFKEVYANIIKDNLLLWALEALSLGEQLQPQEHDDERTKELLPLLGAKAKGYLERFPQLGELLRNIGEGKRFDRWDISSYVFLLRRLPPELSREDQSPTVQKIEDNFEPKVSEKMRDLPVPHQIPPPPVDFTGRGDELIDIVSYFDHGGTIAVLQGIGGIGKTALAFKLAEKLKERYPDGQILVDLRGTSQDPMKSFEVMARIVRSYMPEIKLPEGENELIGIYQSLLHGMHALLLLDNAANREQIEPLLPPSGCALIITSRNKFALQGMPKFFLLDTMKPSEASEFLLKISPRIGNLANELSKLCGFLPLALRAAGSLLASSPDLSPSQYAKELQDERKRLELIGGEGVELDAESSFSLSYSRLRPETAAVFRTLSIFPSDFDAAAEEIICKDLGHRHLSNLLRLSLVDFDPRDGRYRLQDLARLFGASRLEVAESIEPKNRHSEYYQNVLWKANELLLRGGEFIMEGLRLFDSEWPNIQSGQIWADNSMSSNSDIAKICSNFAWAGNILNLRLLPRENIEWLKAALAAARQLADKEAEGSHLGNLGLAYAALGDVKKAIEYYEQYLAISREAGNKVDEGNALGNLGSAYFAMANFNKAVAYYMQHLDIARVIGNKVGEGSALGNLGNTYFALGDAQKAISYYEQALLISREIGDKRSEGIWLGNMGNAYNALGDVKRAIDYYEQHLVIASEIGDKVNEGNALGNLGNAYADQGDFNKAIEYYERHLSIARDIGNKWGEGSALGNLGNAYVALGDSNKGIEYYEHALKIDREIEDKKSEATWLGNLGLAYAGQGDAGKAIRYYMQALEIDREIGDKRSEGTWLSNLGLAYADQGESKKAIEYYEKALAIAREVKDPRGEGHTLFNISHALDRLGERAEAMKSANDALQIFEQIESPYAETVRKQLAEWGA